MVESESESLWLVLISDTDSLGRGLYGGSGKPPPPPAATVSNELKRLGPPPTSGWPNWAIISLAEGACMVHIDNA